MRLNPQLPLDDPFMARIAAQAICYHSFNSKRVVAELRPDIKSHSIFFSKLMSEPAILEQIEVIMNRTERNAKKYLDEVWDWFLAPEPTIEDRLAWKAWNERKVAAARILAKGYINEKKGVSEDDRKPPMVIQGLGDVANLTGETKKVM